MKYVSIDALEPGQFLGKTIFSNNGTVLLSEGVQLTVYMISTLRRIGASFVYVKDEHFDDVELAELVSEETKRAVIKQMNEVFDSIRSGKEFSTKNVSVTAENLLQEILKNKDVLVQLTDIRSKENEAYLHAMNVSMMSVLVGMNMGFNQAQLKDLAIGALLHDIGKVSASPEDDESPDRRKHHTWRGFETLKAKREYSLLIAHAAFQHHERVDGGGIPRGLSDGEIHPYAKIVSVTNAYDNLIAGFTEHGTRMLPHEACERLTAMAGSELDRSVVIEFLKTVSIYPNGASVKLSNKEIGVVVGQHRGLPGRPVVRVVKKEDDELDVVEYDLAKHTTLFIDAVLT